MEERRRIRRDRTFLEGRIAFNNRNSTADCLVRNWTDRGAKIGISETLPAPPEFDLLILARGANRRSRIVWRRGAELGVEFAPRGEG